MTAGTKSWDLRATGRVGRQRLPGVGYASRLTEEDPRAVPTSVQTPIRSRVVALAARAWADAVDRGDLPPVPEEAAAPAIEVQHPSHPEHGDVALNLAMKLARPLRRPPMAIAETLAAALREADGGAMLASVAVAAPGFINLRLAPGLSWPPWTSARAADTDLRARPAWPPRAR